MFNVAVLGGTGMLGSMVADVLSRERDFAVRATVRSEALALRCRRILPDVEWRVLDARCASTPILRDALEEQHWAINAIGITKPYAHDDNPCEIENAIRVNALFPCALAATARDMGVEVLQIATDCVFSGKLGSYSENAAHDALDVYGKTKSLGEVRIEGTHCLRCSIIGPEARSFVFLLEWFRRQRCGATVNGFTNHQWNGITTLHFAKLCEGIIRHNVALNHVQHIIPGGTVSKYDMLRMLRTEFQRADVQIVPTEPGTVVDRTLTTLDPPCNAALWAAAGYPDPPSVSGMITELARFDYRFQDFA